MHLAVGSAGHEEKIHQEGCERCNPCLYIRERRKATSMEHWAVTTATWNVHEKSHSTSYASANSNSRQEYARRDSEPESPCCKTDFGRGRQD